MSAVPRAATRLIIRDLRVRMSIGVHAHEKESPQTVLVNVIAEVNPPDDWRADDYTQVVCYERIAVAILEIAARGHVSLLETFAETIAQAVLAQGRVPSVLVRVEKPDILPHAAGVGVEIVRFS